MKRRKNVSVTWQWRMKMMKDIHILRLRKAHWQTLQQYSDIKLLSDKLKLSTYTISKAIKKGDGDYKTLKAIDKFYSDRLAMLIEERKKQKQHEYNSGSNADDKGISES